MGCIGGKLLDKKGRICGGAYKKDGTVMYSRLPEGFSGGPQHRAVLQQDCAFVDIRCISIRPELIPAYESITGVSYSDSFNGWGDNDAFFASMTDEVIKEMNLKFAEEVKRRGLRAMWDPAVVKRLKV